MLQAKPGNPGLCGKVPANVSVKILVDDVIEPSPLIKFNGSFVRELPECSVALLRGEQKPIKQSILQMFVMS